jgi:hypothetical protein
MLWPGPEEKVSVELDAEMVERARIQLGLARASDATVVERALNAYLLGRCSTPRRHPPG